MIEENNYSGLSRNNNPKEKMKAQQDFERTCLPGGFITTNYYPYFGTCPDYFIDKCSKQWTEECDLFVNNMSLDESKDFLDKTALKKYTKFVSSRKGSNFNSDESPSCDRVYQLADPLTPDSPMVSEIQGSQTFYQDSNGNIRYTHPDLSPTYRVACQDDMDNLKPNVKKGDFTFQDGLFQNCKKFGACREAINVASERNNGYVYETSIAKVRGNMGRVMPNMQNYKNLPYSLLE